MCLLLWRGCFVDAAAAVGGTGAHCFGHLPKREAGSFQGQARKKPLKKRPCVFVQFGWRYEHLLSEPFSF